MTNYAYIGLWGFWGFYNSVELVFVSWRRESFLVGKILINTRNWWDPFLIGIPSIMVNCGVQDISLYRYSWGSCWIRHALYSRWLLLLLSASLFSSAWGFSSSRVDTVGYGGNVVGLWRCQFSTTSHVYEANGLNGVVNFFVCNEFTSF